MSKLQEVAALVESGKVKKVAPAVQEALDEGIAAVELLNTMIDASIITKANIICTKKW